MRIFLLPISTRRTLLYCSKAPGSSTLTSTPEPLSQILRGPINTLPDRIVHRANATWADWERADSGWKATLTKYGNRAFRRIPFEEWGLKSLPPLHASARAALLGDGRQGAIGSTGSDTGPSSSSAKSEQGTAAAVKATHTATVHHPPSFLPASSVVATLQRLATERQPLHRTRLIWSVVGLPVSLPFGLIPVLPNIPFFYLAFRAWSHYRALFGARYLAALVEAGRVKAKADGTLDRVYAVALLDRIEETEDVARRGQGGGRGQSEQAGVPLQGVQGRSKSSPVSSKSGAATTAVAQQKRNELTGVTEKQILVLAEVLKEANAAGKDEVMLLNARSAVLLAEEYGLPELELEVERAVEQVEASLKKARAADNDKDDKAS